MWEMSRLTGEVEEEEEKEGKRPGVDLKGKKEEEEKRVGIAKKVQYGRRLRRISGGGYS